MSKQPYSTPMLTPRPLLGSVLHGDCLALLKTLPSNSVDAIVRNLFHAIQHTYGNCDRGIQRYSDSSHRWGYRTNLRALRGEHQGRDEVVSSLYGNDDRCNYLEVLQSAVKLSNQGRSTQDSRRAMLDYFHLYGKRCSNQESRKHSLLYYFVAMIAPQMISDNLGKLEYAFCFAFFYGLGYVKQLTETLFLLLYKYKVWLLLVWLHLWNVQRNDIDVNKKYHASLSQVEQENAIHPCYMWRTCNKLCLLFLLLLTRKSKIGYKLFAVHVSSVASQLDRFSHSLGKSFELNRYCSPYQNYNTLLGLSQQDAEYVAIAEARIAHARQHGPIAPLQLWEVSA